MILSHRESGKKGLLCVEAEYDGSNVSFPYGIVWYQIYNAHEEHVCIKQSYVVNHKRRKGVRTAIHEYMRELYPHLPFYTGTAANDASWEWLQKMGFKQEKGPYGMGWYLPAKEEK